MPKLALSRAMASARETLAADRIPLTSHVADGVAMTKRGLYVQCFRLGGASFETIDDVVLNSWHDRLNGFIRAVGTERVAFWTHIVRDRDRTYPGAKFSNAFAAQLDAKYRERMAGQTLMTNQLFLSVVFNPMPGKVGRAALGLANRASRADVKAELADALEECARLSRQAVESLARYDPEPLGLYRAPDTGLMCSSIAELYAFLATGAWRRVPVGRSDLCHAVATGRPLFGAETIELRTPSATRLSAILGVARYPSLTPPGVLSTLLTADFPLVLTQSFTCLPRALAVDLAKRQMRVSVSAGEALASDQEDLESLLASLVRGEVVLGDHHMTLQVQSDPYDAAEDQAAALVRVKQLSERVGRAVAMMGDRDVTMAREDIALESAFWAQLPGNAEWRPRKTPVSSANFGGMSPFLNYPTGRASGNWWGAPLAMFATSSNAPFHWSLHASDPKAANGGSKKDVGHTFGIGSTGSGKTTFMGFCIARASQFGARQVVFDIGEGMHILVRVMGGVYLPFSLGEPTGANPLMLEPTSRNTEFMRQWLRQLVRRPGEQLSTVQESDLEQALRSTLALPLESRRLTRLVEHLDVTDPEGMYARLVRWTRGNEYGWVFDNDHDSVAALLLATRTPIIGFDVGPFIKNDTLRGPLSMYLMHLVDQMVGRGRLIVWIDEAKPYLQDEWMAPYFAEGLERWRKADANLIPFTQSPHHVIKSPIARTLIEQTPTKIYFPNPEATYADYVEGFSLSEREFKLIKEEIEPGSRQVLIKQGHVSVVVRLDLSGFADELDVISGRVENVTLMKALIAQHGEQLDAWLPHFRAAMADRRRLSRGASILDSSSHTAPPAVSTPSAPLALPALPSKEHRHAA